MSIIYDFASISRAIDRPSASLVQWVNLRVSADHREDGHDNYADIYGRGLDISVYLDGALQSTCVTADPNEGWIDRFNMNSVYLTRERVYGAVKIASYPRGSTAPNSLDVNQHDHGFDPPQF